MVEGSTLVSLPQMVDLALNCPEIGTVNYNVLHVLLQVLLQQVNKDGVALEFRGKDSDRLQNLITMSKPSPAPFLSEYTIVGGDGPKRRKSKTKAVSLSDIKEVDEKELRVIDRRKDSKTVVVVDSSGKLPQFSVAVTKASFEQLQTEVTDMKAKIKELVDLPANMGLIEATRSHSGPIVDMFQMLNLTKRVDAAEAGMEKVVTLIQDLAREQGGEGGEGASRIEEILSKADAVRTSIEKRDSSSGNEMEKRLENLENVVNEMIESIQAGAGVFASARPSKGSGSRSTKGESLASDHKKSDTTPLPSPKKPGGGVRKTPRGSAAAPKSVLAGVDLTELTTEEAMNLFQQELANIQEWMEQNKDVLDELDILKAQINKPSAGDDLPPGLKLNMMESRFTDCLEQLANLDLSYNGQINMLQEQMNAVQNETADLMSRLTKILPGGDSTGIDAEATMELGTKLADLEEKMVTLQEVAAKHEQDREERDKSMETIIEQIDLLKIVKANREDLEDALGDKADACMINRKVSHDQFETACDDLSRGIEEALTKLGEQEDLWHQALDAIQREVGNKLDKNEVDPLRDFVNNKLKALQDKFKSLTALKKEQEAAGTKSKFLRNVNCISCDKDVVMRKEMDPSMRPQAKSLPPSRNIAPYLAYELDQLRKQQKCIPNSKNLNFFENAMKKQPKDKDHLCNRYCGGSHTVTTPQQRVTRLGHFLEQWGPEIAPLQDEYVKGTDQHMYKARDDEQLNKIKQTGILPGKPSATSKGTVDDKSGAQKPPNAEDVVTKDSQDHKRISVNEEAEQMLKKERPKTTGDIKDA